MSLTINAKTYNADSFAQNAIEYIGPAKTASIKDNVVLRRSAAKATDSFSGLSRTTAKMTRTLALTGAKTPTGDAIIEVPVAIPVGYASVDVDTLLNDMGAFISSASFKAHVKSQQLNF